MIPWDGGDVHDPTRPAGCWGDRRGRECEEPTSSATGLCGDCTFRLTGERPPLQLFPTPPSEAFLTGAGRR